MKSPRRHFLGTLAAFPVLPLSGAPAAAAPAPPAAGSGLAEGLLAAARARYQLTPAEAGEVEKAIQEGLKAADRLRAVPLVNSDEPVLTFEARPAAVGRRS